MKSSILRSILIACVAGSFVAAVSPSQADAIVYDSGGFEATRFLDTRALEAQDQWQKDSGVSTATVTTNYPGGGLQSVLITRAASANGDTRWYVPTPLTPGPYMNVVDVACDLRVSMAAGTVGPAFGLDAYDGSSLIGSLAMDASTGEVLYVQTGTHRVLSTGTVLKRGAYHHFILEADFAHQTCSVIADGVVLHTEPFVSGASRGVSIVSLSAYSVDPATVATATGTAYADNFAVTQKRVNFPPPPAAPAMLNAQGGRQQIGLSWSASSGATSYNLYRGTSTGAEILAQSGLAGTTYTDTGLADGVTYYYTVSAVSAYGEGGKSPEASAATVPPAPTGLTATGGPGQVSVSWTAAAGAGSYSVFRGSSPGGESATPIANGLTTTSYADADPSLTDGATYYYTVTASNTTGSSSSSTEVSATTAPPDLSCDSLTASPSAPGVGDSVTLTATVTNHSARTTASGETVAFADGGTALGSATLPSLAPGASGMASVTWTPSSAGSHTLSATAVALSGETNVSNNTASATMTVYNYYTYTTTAGFVGKGKANGVTDIDNWYKFNIGVPMNMVREVRVTVPVSTYDPSGSKAVGAPNPYLQSYTGDGTNDLASVGTVTPTGIGNWVMDSTDPAVLATVKPLADNYLDLWIRGLNKTLNVRDTVVTGGFTIQIKYLAP